ncbi:glycosyl hydrolase 115 family protein [Duncaniella muricolitica]|jgi:hypothetical protein|uniref:glycosyl hydrolase 115 family protein n=1 Tax=Duncaniella muricolitica TaxID=2880704 RepID=UPI00244E4F00|nr:glycosyl hydrolase 115 family protein [Duncaniella muricolitica]
MSKKILTGIFLSVTSCFISEANAVTWFDGVSPVSVGKNTSLSLVAETSIDMFTSDMKSVTGQYARLIHPAKARIVLTQLDRASKSQRRKLIQAGVPVERLDTLVDGFNIKVNGDKILVTGSNGRGTAYGLLELSREAGVSPWIWWGDVLPVQQQSLTLPDDYNITQGASVELRGIFLNDEDWSLRPWSSMTFEPNESGTIGPRTYKEIFKLLMRLRANAIWPAMHKETTAFFKNPVNKLVADSCGISVGTSHCEPLLRNNVDEWDVSKRGPFNYITNRQAVQEYWIERLREVKGSEGGNMFTIGMRGIHDGSMEGVKTKEEKFAALQQVIDDQQQLLADYIGAPNKQMQVFVPYKEVLQLYDMGLNVPAAATLMWCDDNYGYITRLSTDEEQKRPGGGGVYYHLSYWGRPHDYLWLTTTQPGLIYNEMRNAYNHNVRKLWIANVHDPKVAAYDLELFLDLAWNIDIVEPENLGQHLCNWLTTNFGADVSQKIYTAMRKFYNLTGKRRPEFMGWNQVELDKKLYHRGLSPVADTELSFTEFGGEADRYIREFLEIAKIVEDAGQSIDPSLRDAYFAAIIYPVLSASNNAVKMLEAQRARSFASGGVNNDIDNSKLYLATARSQEAYRNIRALTETYNEKMSGGKWRKSMNMSPRDLPAGYAPMLPVILTEDEMSEYLVKDTSHEDCNLDADGAIAFNADDFSDISGDYHVIDLLGHSNRAVELEKSGSVTYSFAIDDDLAESLLTVAMIPTHANDKVRYNVSIDGGEPIEFNLKEPFRSERWKVNVLRGQARRSIKLPHLEKGNHKITITAVDSHIVVDQICIDPKINRKYYLIPTIAK